MMMAKIAALTLVLIEVTALTARAQAPDERQNTVYELFDALSGAITTGGFFYIFHNKDLPDYKSPFPELIEEKRFRSTDSLPMEGGSWRASDLAGTVRINLFVPVHGSRDSGSVSFVPARQLLLPAPILTHLLAKAVRTTISGAETITLAFPREQFLGLLGVSCSSERTITIAMGTGAMLAHTVTTDCEAPKEGAPLR